MINIKLIPIFKGNPFSTHPQLRTIFEEPLNSHVEQDTINDLQLGTNDPSCNKIYLVEDEEKNIIGFTGFFQPTNDPSIKTLRWHGVIPSHRQKGYSSLIFKELCSIVSIIQPKIKNFIELVPLKDQKNAHNIIRHFEKLGFKSENIKKADEFSPAFGLPIDSGQWLIMRFSISN